MLAAGQLCACVYSTSGAQISARVLLLLKKMTQQQQQQLENILSTENLLKYSKTLQLGGTPTGDALWLARSANASNTSGSNK